MKEKAIEYWFPIDTAYGINYVCAVQDAWPYKTLGGIIASEKDLKGLLERGETLGKNMPRKPRNIDVENNFRGQWWAKAGIKRVKTNK